MVSSESNWSTKENNCRGEGRKIKLLNKVTLSYSRNKNCLLKSLGLKLLAFLRNSGFKSKFLKFKPFSVLEKSL